MERDEGVMIDILLEAKERKFAVTNREVATQRRINEVFGRDMDYGINECDPAKHYNAVLLAEEGYIVTEPHISDRETFWIVRLTNRGHNALERILTRPAPKRPLGFF